MKYRAIVEKKKSREILYDVVRKLEREIQDSWNSFPSDEEVVLVVKLVEELGYRVKSTRKFQHGTVGIVLTDSTAFTKANWGSVRAKFKTQPLLEVYWTNFWVSDDPENHPYSGMGHRVDHFGARITTSMSSEELEKVLREYERTHPE